MPQLPQAEKRHKWYRAWRATDAGKARTAFGERHGYDIMPSVAPQGHYIPRAKRDMRHFSACGILKCASLAGAQMNKRQATLRRETGETRIAATLELDGSGKSEIHTGVAFFDHMLTLLSKHSLIDLQVQAEGDLSVDYHHTVEDTGIVLGECVKQALGSKSGLRRYGWALLPMDEALVEVALDLSGRFYLAFEAPDFPQPIGTFDFQLVEEFLRGFAANAGMNLHVTVKRGRNAHHVAEAIFKGLAKALDQACQVDARVIGIPSSKGIL